MPLIVSRIDTLRKPQRTLLQGQSSNEAPVVRDVYEESVLGLILYYVFINDLPDDSQVKSKDDQGILHTDLNTLATWEKT